jgi:hypothetical protein
MRNRLRTARIVRVLRSAGGPSPADCPAARAACGEIGATFVGTEHAMVKLNSYRDDPRNRDKRALTRAGSCHASRCPDRHRHRRRRYLCRRMCAFRRGSRFGGSTSPAAGSRVRSSSSLVRDAFQRGSPPRAGQPGERPELAVRPRRVRSSFLSRRNGPHRRRVLHRSP